MAYTTPKTWAVGDVLTASDMNTYVRDQLLAMFPLDNTPATYTPSLTASTTNPTLGTGSVQTGLYFQIGKMVFAHFRIKFGTAGVAVGAGLYRVGMPVSAHATMYGSFIRCGSGFFFDSSVPLNYLATFYFVNTGAVEINIDGRGTAQTAADPVIPAASDEWSGTVVYTAA